MQAVSTPQSGNLFASTIRRHASRRRIPFRWGGACVLAEEPRGAASPREPGLRWTSLGRSEDAAQASIAQAAFDFARSDRNRGSLPPPDYMGSNFNPYTSSPC